MREGVTEAVGEAKRVAVAVADVGVTGVPAGVGGNALLVATTTKRQEASGESLSPGGHRSGRRLLTIVSVGSPTATAYTTPGLTSKSE